MEKKELQSMKKHRGLFLSLGLAALLSLSARQASAETMSLTVFLNGVNIYSTVGGPQSVTADTDPTGALNTALLGTGYSFSSLSGQSNLPGDSVVGAFVSDSGNVSFAAGGTGGTLMIVVTEDGFMAPASGAGNQLLSNQTATFTGTTGASSQSYVGNFNDHAGVNQDLATVPPTLFGNTPIAQDASAMAGLPPYALPFQLTNTTTIVLDSLSTDPSFPGNDVFTGTTSVLAIPEPASLIMMATGMPVSLVVMGLRRRRRRAA
jgi:hypothetical protein